ncbi:heparinase II/III domain-containing protein [Luteimonas mephitis]|uniref:heparinase II/III domain-containing protein n=1 Tax=Luteimonas mephitis TaxID=83615 RepID=UPI003A91D2D1
MSMAPGVQVPPHPFQIHASAFAERLTLICGNAHLASTGRQVVENSTYVFTGFAPVRVDLFSDWTADPYGSRSWQWNTAAFNFLPAVIAYHAANGSPAAIDFALQTVDSWRKAAATVLGDYEFARHDHASAIRAENTMLLLAYLHSRGLAQDRWEGLAALVDEIASLLEEESFYSRHTNHGIEQSRVLALAADMFPACEASNRRWKLAEQRLTDELGFAFTDEGVNVENSPAYHLYVCGIFLRIIDELPREELVALRAAVDAVMPKAMEFITHMIRPDGMLPIIGDTAARSAGNRFRRYFGCPQYQWLEYATSGRVRGQPPAKSIAAFPEAGYLVVRDRWKPPRAPGREFHLILKCGCRSRYHRHDDDFNIVLVCGEDWLIDGGAYSYDENDVVRRYLRSKWAHNVPVVDEGERWLPVPRKLHNAQLKVRQDGQRTIAVAISAAYDGYSASRRLTVQPRKRCFSVQDRIEPVVVGAKRMFRSLWHVPAERDIYRRGQDILVRSRKGPQAMSIRSVGVGFDEVGLLRPGLPGHANGVVSWQANKLKPAKIVAFSILAGALDSRLEFNLFEIPDPLEDGWEPL